jgi:hypothetical protein
MPCRVPSDGFAKVVVPEKEMQGNDCRVKRFVRDESSK